MGVSLRLVGLTLVGALLGLGQSGTSTISGIVQDQSGSAVTDAQVKVTNEENGSSVTLRTNGDGLYRAGSLLPGAYRV